LALRYFASHEPGADVEVDGTRRGASERAIVVLSEFRCPGCNTKPKHQIFANICKYNQSHVCLFGKNRHLYLIDCLVTYQTNKQIFDSCLFVAESGAYIFTRLRSGV
jgi:hypothetical protein